MATDGSPQQVISPGVESAQLKFSPEASSVQTPAGAGTRAGQSVVLLSLTVHCPQHWSAPFPWMAQVCEAPWATRVKGPGLTRGGLGGKGLGAPDGG
jgi:hypothetical protein